MNERIKELAEQAGLQQRIWNSLGKELLMWQEDPDNPGLEKFAELIVKDVFAMIKESCVDADVMDRVDEVIDDRLNDAASDVVDAYGITDRIY